MDYVKIMESTRLKIEEDSLAIITSSVSLVFLSLCLFLSQPLFHLLCGMHANTHALLPLLFGAIIIFCEFPMWQCGTEPA